MEPWSYSIELGRGVEQSLASERLEGTQRWPEGAPTVPEWSVLDGNWFHQDDLPRDCEQDENPCLLVLRELDLELTDEQKDMLNAPEERIK
eukprot:2849683-Pyramimonas_sp.AAC.1